MATANQFHPRTYEADFTLDHTRTRLWAVPVGRCLYALIFVLSGLNHFTSGSIAYAANAGVPMAKILVPFSGLMILVGGISVMLGFRARFGALLIALFLIPVTVVMHAFWNVSEPMMAQNQMAHFMKNVALLGGAVLLMFYGSGPKSIDHHHRDSNTPANGHVGTDF